MKEPYAFPKDITDKGGMPVDGSLLKLAYLLWTMPERGLSVSDLSGVLNRVARDSGHGEISAGSVNRFARAMRENGVVSRSRLTGRHYLSDKQMKIRQLFVFKDGWRDTHLDKMDRIRTFALCGVPHHRQGKAAASKEFFDPFSFLDLMDHMEAAR